MIWATLSRWAVQASDLVKDPKILLETFIKIQNVERNLTVQCVQLSSSSQSGFLPCYHLKIKGMHLYYFSPGRSCSIPTCIWAQVRGLSYYMEMGKERPKLPSDRLCSLKAPCWKGDVCFLMHCGCHLLWARVRSCSSQEFTYPACLAARRNSLWSCWGFDVFTFWCCYPQVLWVFCCGNFQETVRFGFLR